MVLNKVIAASNSLIRRNLNFPIYLQNAAGGQNMHMSAVEEIDACA